MREVSSPDGIVSGETHLGNKWGYGTKRQSTSVDGEFSGLTSVSAS